LQLNPNSDFSQILDNSYNWL